MNYALRTYRANEKKRKIKKKRIEQMEIKDVKERRERYGGLCHCSYHIDIREKYFEETKINEKKKICETFTPLVTIVIHIYLIYKKHRPRCAAHK